jgi:hypothetical protein
MPYWAGGDSNSDHRDPETVGWSSHGGEESLKFSGSSPFLSREC